MWPHRRQPTRLPRPWDSPGKNTGVGCHFLLQCMKVKSESEVVQSCPTPRNPMDCSLPDSSVHRIFQARVLEWGAIAFSDYPSLVLHWSFCPTCVQGTSKRLLKRKQSRWDRVTEQQKSLWEEQAQGDPLSVDHLERDEFDIIRKLPFPYSYCNFRPLCALKVGFKNLSQFRHKAQEL